MSYVDSEVKCANCKKNFIPAPYHVYHIGGKMFCSWTCYNQRKYGDGCDKKYHYKTIEQLTLDGKLVREIKGAMEAVTIADGTVDGMRRAIKYGTKYKGYLWRYKECGAQNVKAEK